jgi:hypothetical protein
MAEDRTHKENTIKERRRLGDEWADWDGQVENLSTDTDGRVFIGVAIATIVAILGLTALLGWLIYPRLDQIGAIARTTFTAVYGLLALVLLVWLVLFIWGAASTRPFFSTLIIVPKLVNLLLEISIGIGKLFGLSRDRLVNSFLKLHNIFINSDPRRVQPDKMLVLMPRCLTRDNNIALRRMRDRYGFILGAAGGGGEARRKIRETRPALIIAIACERDLLTGFVDVNPHIPVIGFPNYRPCGPCKNTEVNLGDIESTVKRHLVASDS